MEDIYRQIIELIEQVPKKRYGELNHLLAQELGLQLIDLKEGNKS